MVAIKSSCFLRQFDCFLGGSGWNAWNVENYYIDGEHQPTHFCSFRLLGCSHNRASCMMPPPHPLTHTPTHTHTDPPLTPTSLSWYMAYLLPNGWPGDDRRHCSSLFKRVSLRTWQIKLILNCVWLSYCLTTLAPVVSHVNATIVSVNPGDTILSQGKEQRSQDRALGREVLRLTCADCGLPERKSSSQVYRGCWSSGLPVRPSSFMIIEGCDFKPPTSQIF